MKRSFKNTSEDLSNLSDTLRKKLKVSKNDTDDNFIKSFQKQQIKDDKPLTEDEQYEIAMKELKDLVKSRVSTHLKSQQMDVDNKKEREAMIKRRKEKEDLEKLLDEAYDIQERKK